MNIGIGTKLFILGRKIIFPFEKIVDYIPQKGTILDVGCGHGTLSLLIAKKYPNAKILGIDPSLAKIKQANILSKNQENVEFKKTYLGRLRDKNFACIVIVDVACLMPDRDKLTLLKEARKRLKRGGVLLLKEVEKTNSYFYYFMLFEEFLMAKVFKLTFTKHNKTYLMTKSEYKKLLEVSGFRVKSIKRIKGPLPYPHILFIAY